MLYHLLPDLADVYNVFNLFRYITFRAAGALVTSLVLAFVLGPMTIRGLKRFRIGQVVRADGPATHLPKAGTPTMGGALIVMSASVSTLLWAELTNWYTVLALLTFVAMGALGFMDDYLKVVQGRTAGLIARYKMLGQWTFGLGLGLFLLLNPISPVPPNHTMVPFFSDVALVFHPWIYVLFVGFVISGSANAVNITDGLDGLATGLMAIAASTFAVFAYLLGRADFSEYLGLFYLPGAGELSVLRTRPGRWLPRFPLGSTPIPPRSSWATRVRSLLEAPSGSWPFCSRRSFSWRSWGVSSSWRCSRWFSRSGTSGTRQRSTAPAEDSSEWPRSITTSEQLGWPESKIVVRFWIMGILCAMVAFSALKIR